MAVATNQNYPWTVVGLTHIHSDSALTLTMDAATPTCFAYAFVVPSNPFGGTLKFSGCRWYCTTNTGSAKVTAYLVGDVNGVPDVIASALATGDEITIGTAPLWTDQTFGTPYTLTAGTQYWVVLKCTSGTSAVITYGQSNGNGAWSTIAILGGGTAATWRAVADSGTGAAWGGTDRPAVCGIRIKLTDDTDTAYLGYPVQGASALSATYKIDGSTETGVCFTTPANTGIYVKSVIVGIRKFVSPGNISCKLYTGTSTSATATSNAVPVGNTGTINAIQFDFGTPVALAGGTQYRFVLSAASGDASNYYGIYAATIDSDSVTGGTVNLVPWATALTRLASGSWDGGGSPTYTVVPTFAMILSTTGEFVAPDFPAAGNVLNSDTTNGVQGTLTVPLRCSLSDVNATL